MQGDDDVEATMDAEGSGERLMMLPRLWINCERSQDRGGRPRMLRMTIVLSPRILRVYMIVAEPDSVDMRLRC